MKRLLSRLANSHHRFWCLQFAFDFGHCLWMPIFFCQLCYRWQQLHETIYQETPQILKFYSFGNFIFFSLVLNKKLRDHGLTLAPTKIKMWTSWNSNFANMWNHAHSIFRHHPFFFCALYVIGYIRIFWHHRSATANWIILTKSHILNWN